MSRAPKEISRLPAAVIQFIIKANWSLLQRRCTGKKYFNSWFIFPVKSYSCQSTYGFLKGWFCLHSLRYARSWVCSWLENNSLRSFEEATLHEEVPTDNQWPLAHTSSLKSQSLGRQERSLLRDMLEWNKPLVPSLPTCPATASCSKPAIQNRQFGQQSPRLLNTGLLWNRTVL